MEQGPRRPHRGRSGAGPAPVAHVNRFSEQRVTGFAEMNADLVLPPGLEPAGHQRCVRERFLDLDVGDRESRFGRRRRGASPVPLP